MKRSKLTALAVLPFAFLIGCAAEEEPEVAEEPIVAEVQPAPVATMPAMGAGAGGTMVNLQPLNNSGVTGEATLNEMSGRTEVTVRLAGSPGAGMHQGHIHQGTCDSLGSVVTPLQPIQTDAGGSGTMTTTVDIPAATVMNGQHLIAYHEADGSPGAPVVCGNIPSQAAM